MRSWVAVAACLVALAGCSSDGSDDADATDDSSDGASTEQPGRATPAPFASVAEVCEEVTLGIDAFNYGDLDETVEHFEKALPLAEDAVEAESTNETQAMLDAVRYYAELPADDYLEASESSPEFQRHKFTTLTLCDYQNPPPSGPGDPGDGPSSGIDA